MSTNTIFQNPVTTKITIPASVALAGYTVTSDGVTCTVAGAPVDDLYGTAVRLLTRNHDIAKGMYLYDAVQDEMREIVSISYSGEHFTIASPFSAPLAAIALVVIPRSDFEEISVTGIAGTAIIIDADDNSANLLTGQTVGVHKQLKNRGENGFVGPLIVDASGGGVEVSIQKLR